MTEENEQAYLSGERAARLSMLRTILRDLGIDDPEAGKARWVSEREETIAVLRRLCGEHGDNEWDETLHLADVIDKHLGDYLESTVKLENEPLVTLTVTPEGGASLTFHKSKALLGQHDLYEKAK